MRALLPTDTGRPEIGDLPDPELRPGEVLLDVRATALNQADLLQVKGFYPPPPGESEVPGLECSGVVLECAEGTEGVDVGMRAMALLAGGGHGTRVAVPSGQLMPIPERLSFEEAAALPEAAMTAWTNLVVEGGLARGQSVLIQGATSGVGTFAVQLAHELGATVVACGRSIDRLERLRDLGADALVVADAALEAAIAEVTAGRGVDLVLDLVGGAALQRSLACLVPRGRLVLVGLLGGRQAELDLGLLLRHRLEIRGSVLRPRSREEKAALIASFLDFASPRLADGRLAPVLDRVMPFEQLPAAYQLMAEGGHLGKIVLTVGS